MRSPVKYTLVILVAIAAVVSFAVGSRVAEQRTDQGMEPRALATAPPEESSLLVEATVVERGERTGIVAIENVRAEKATLPDEGPEFWELHYRHATVGQLIDERRALQKVVYEESDPYFEDAWRLGWYEVLKGESVEGAAEGGKLRLPSEPGQIVRWRVDSQSNEVRRATLPRENHESTYLAYEKASWLLGREQELRRSDTYEK